MNSYGGGNYKPENRRELFSDPNLILRTVPKFSNSDRMGREGGVAVTYCLLFLLISLNNIWL